MPFDRYIGIDVSKAALDAHVLPAGEVLYVSRDGAVIDALVKWACAREPRVIALEATGGFERVVTAELNAVGLPVVVVNPARIRDFASAISLRRRAASRRLARSCQRLIKALESELADADDDIGRAVQASADWRAKQESCCAACREWGRRYPLS